MSCFSCVAVVQVPPRTRGRWLPGHTGAARCNVGILGMSLIFPPLNTSRFCAPSMGTWPDSPCCPGPSREAWRPPHHLVSGGRSGFLQRVVLWAVTAVQQQAALKCWSPTLQDASLRADACFRVCSSWVENLLCQLSPKSWICSKSAVLPFL